MTIQKVVALFLSVNLILMTACGGGNKTNRPDKTLSNLQTLSGVVQKVPRNLMHLLFYINWIMRRSAQVAS